MNKWSRYLDLPAVAEARKLIKENYQQKLKFVEETHQYFLGEQELECVSNVVNKWSATNEEAMLDAAARKAQRYPDYRYYGNTREQIKAIWEEAGRVACEFGTKCHAFGEDMFYKMTGQSDKELVPTCGHEEAIVNFWNALPENYIPVLAETQVFNTQDGLAYAGTFDILFYYHNETDPSKSGFMIFDYKTNKALENEYARTHEGRMLQPFGELFEESLSHYCLQLGLYQLPLEQLGLKVIGRRLVWLNGDGSYELRKLPDYTGKLRNALKNL